MNNISFIHRGGEGMASYRYRAKIPAESLGASINDARADVLIFSKPMPGDEDIAREAKEHGKTVIVDFCDDHFKTPLYQAMLGLAEVVVCSTLELAYLCPRASHIVRDTYEFPEVEPHCNGGNLLWFGHKGNLSTIQRTGIEARIVCNAPGCIPWSLETMDAEFALADIVLMPATAPYKSPNRTLEAIRQGCFVVAEPHPAINDFPVYIGDLKEGIEWAKNNQSEANKMIRKAQRFITEKYSPAIQASAWKRVLESASTLAQERSNGLGGSALTYQTMQT